MLHACEAASRAWCYDLTSNMMSTLPRELRDLIYTHLLESTHVTKATEHVLSVPTLGTWSLIEYSDDSGNLDGAFDTFVYHSIPHFALFQYVYETFRIELAQTLYRTKLLRVPCVPDLDKILNYDAFTTSCAPKEHIRHIEILLTFDYCTQTRAHYAKAVKPLCYLGDIKSTSGLRVDLVISFKFETVLNMVVEAVAPLVHPLLSEGVDVVWYKKWYDSPKRIEVVVPTRDLERSPQEPKDEATAGSLFVSRPDYMERSKLIT
jgi:hypothetical protein